MEDNGKKKKKKAAKKMTLVAQSAKMASATQAAYAKQVGKKIASAAKNARDLSTPLAPSIFRK